MAGLQDHKYISRAPFGTKPKTNSLKGFLLPVSGVGKYKGSKWKRDECEWSPKFQWTPHAVIEVDVKFGSRDVISASVQLRHGKDIPLGNRSVH